MVEAQAEPVAGAVPVRAEAQQLRVMFLVHSLSGYLRFFDPVFRELVARGHHLQLVVEQLEPEGRRERRWLEQMAEHERFTWETQNMLRRDRWFKPSKAVRQALDYVRVLGPEFEDRPYFRRRGEGRSPTFIQRVMRPRLMRSAGVRSAIESVLSCLDRAMPVGRDARAYLTQHRPDVLALSPHLSPGSLHSTYVTQAQLLGIPVAMLIASWDNLSSKQLIRTRPDRLIVWNETQRREASEIHDIDPSTVAVTGAQVFDHWFGWQSRPRHEFLARVGLDPAQPYLLYVGGALMRAAQTEAQWVEGWLERLRGASDPRLRDVGVLVRPHPKRNSEWEHVDLSRHANVVVFPKGGLRMPIERDLQADYFDSILHSGAVVGLNSTAMIEAAIAGRPVLTMLVDEFYDSQLGVFHFEYLMNVAGGVVRPSRTFDEHHSQLAEALFSDATASAERARRFVADFVRPRGLDKPATPFVADTIEDVARTGRSLDSREPLWVRLLRLAIILAVYATKPREVRRGIAIRLRRLGRGLVPA